MRIALVAAAGCALAVGACAMPWEKQASKEDLVPIAGTKWVGVFDAITDPQHRPRLEFTAAGRVAGFTGCNGLGAYYEMRQGEVRFIDIVVSKRYCDGPAGEAERRLMEAFGEGSRAVRKDGRLVVSAREGGRFDFVPAN